MPDKHNWPTVAFGDVVKLNRDRIAKPLAEGVERYVGIEHIEAEDLRIRSWGLVADGTTFTNQFRPGQVLFVKRRAYQRKVALAEFEGVCSGDIYVLESKDPDILLPELLPFICQTDGFFEHAVGTSAGSLSPRTNWKQLAAYEFPLPPLGEQRRIAEALRCLNNENEGLMVLRKSHENLLLSTRESLLIDIADEREVSTKSSSTYSQKLLRDVADITMGFAFSSALFSETGVQLIRMGNVTEGRLDLDKNPVFLPSNTCNEYNRFVVHPDDIVMSMTGTLGKMDYGFAARVPTDAPILMLNQRVCRLRSRDGYDQGWLFHYCRSRGLLRQIYSRAAGTKQANLSRSDLETIPLLCPAIEKQRVVANRLDQLEKAVMRIDQRIDDAATQKHYFVERALSGRWPTIDYEETSIY